MLVGSRFAYLHPPKCAGEFATKWLAAAGLGIADEVHPRKHAGYVDVEDSIRGLTIVSSARNPWNLLRSWYHYTAATGPGGGPSGFHRLLAGRVPDTLVDVSRAALRLHDVLGRDHLSAWPNAGSPPLPIVRVCERLRCGLMTYFLLRLWLRDPSILLRIERDELVERLDELLAVDVVVSTERIVPDLLVALRAHGVEFAPPRRERLERIAPVNVASRRVGRTAYSGPASEAFDAETVGLVREREWLPILLLGYEGPDAGPTRSPWMRSTSSASPPRSDA